MMRRTLSLAALAVAALALSVTFSRADLLAPGRYCGHAVTDRWGQNVFHTGCRHLFLSQDVSEQLLRYRGAPLRLVVSRLDQPVSDDAGMIRAVEMVSVRGAYDGLQLYAQAKDTSVEQGQGITLRLSLRNWSREDVAVPAGVFAVALVTRTPFPNEAIGYSDPDGRAYWYFTSQWRPSQGAPGAALLVACHRIILPWSAGQLVETGRKIRAADVEQFGRDQVIIGPGGRFLTEVTVGRELPPGEYEAFFYIETNNFSNLSGPTSKRIAFDVTAPAPE